MEFFSSIVLLFIVLLLPQVRRLYVSTPRNTLNTNLKERDVFFDTAKGLAIIAVILIHAVYIFELKRPDFDRFWLNSINNLARFAVGFFFISSGALLTSGITKKKVSRIALPYIIVCTLVGISQQKSWDLVVGGIFRGDLLPPFYFIPVLFQFYLLYPLLNKLRKKNYFLLLSLAVSYVFYAIPALWSFLGVPTFGPYLFLFSFGIAYSEKLRGKKSSESLSLWLIVILSYVVLQFVFSTHYFNSRFFYAPALFVVLHHFYRSIHVRKGNVLPFVGRLSLWIYLIHFSIEAFIMEIWGYNFDYSVYVYLFIVILFTVFLSIGSSYLLQKVYKAMIIALQDVFKMNLTGE